MTKAQAPALPDGWTASRSGSFFTVFDADGIEVGRWNGRAATERGAAEALQLERADTADAEDAGLALADARIAAGLDDPVPPRALYTDGNGREFQAERIGAAPGPAGRAHLRYTGPDGNLHHVTADHSRKPHPGTYRNP